MRSRMNRSGIIFAIVIISCCLISDSTYSSETGESKKTLLSKFGEPLRIEKFDHLEDMLFWGKLDPKGKTYEYWAYDGVVNMNGYGTPGKTIVFDKNKMIVYMLVCPPSLYRCEWTLEETLPPDLRHIAPIIISEKQLKEAGWSNDRAQAIFIWKTSRVYLEAVISEHNSGNWINSKIFGFVKTYPDYLRSEIPRKN